MEFWIIPFNCVQKLIYADSCIQFFVNLTNESLFRSFPFFHFSARKFPPIFEFSISALSCKNLISFAYDSSNNFYFFHNDCSVIYS